MYSKLKVLNFIINIFGARAYRQISDEKILNRHSDVVRLIKRGLSIRNISAITNKSTNTVLKVKRII